MNNTMNAAEYIPVVGKRLTPRLCLYGLALIVTGCYFVMGHFGSSNPHWTFVNLPLSTGFILLLSLAGVETYLQFLRLKEQQQELQTARVREEDLTRRLAQQRQSLLNQISRALVDRLEYNQMPAEVPEKIAHLFHADVVIVWTTVNTEPVSFKMVTQHGLPLATVALLQADTWDIPAFEDPAATAGQLLIESMPVTTSDMLTHFCATHHLDTAALTPIISRTRLVGLVGVFYRKRTALCPAITSEMQMTANLIASAIQAEELYRDLIQAQKVETIGSLASGIAHDFNNVLAAILACATYVKQHTARNTEVFRYLEATESSAHRGAALTKQLLSFARRDGPRLTVFDLNSVVDQTFQLISRSFDKGILYHRQLAADLHPIEADPSQVEQIILNLAVNARDAMPQGGIITILTRNITLNMRNPHRPNLPLPDGDYILLSIRDTGTGMSAETMRKIFQPFFTTKQRGKGTGLGLSMVLSIVKGFGGHIHVQSAVGKGTQFDVYLPATDKPVPVAATASGALAAGGTETILLAEDEDMIREMAKITLESKGYRVITAPDGAAAATAYRENWRSIKLVIADMVMPRMSGPELLSALREVNPHVRVVVSSGFSHDQEGQRMLEHGCLAYLQKPYNPDVLLRVTRQVLDSGL